MTSPTVTPAKLQQLVRHWTQLWREWHPRQFAKRYPDRHDRDAYAIEERFRSITPDLARAATDLGIRCTPLFDFSSNVRGANERTADPAWSLVKELSTHCPEDPIDPTVETLHFIRNSIISCPLVVHDLDLECRDVRLGYVTEGEQLVRNIQQYETQVIGREMSSAAVALITLNRELPFLPFIELTKSYRHRRRWDARNAIKACAQWADPRFRGFETFDPQELPQVYVGALSVIIEALCAIEVPVESMPSPSPAPGPASQQPTEGNATDNWVGPIAKTRIKNALNIYSRAWQKWLRGNSFALRASGDIAMAKKVEVNLAALCVADRKRIAAVIASDLGDDIRGRFVDKTADHLA